MPRHCVFELDVQFILFKFILTVHFAKNNISYSLGIYEKCLSCICIKFYDWERTEYCFSQGFLGFFLDGKGSLVTWTQALRLSFLPLVFPLWQDIVFCILMVLSWYPKEYTSGLSFFRPNFRWLPKYSSTGSWQNLSVNSYSIPSSRNLVASMAQCTVILKPSNVCHDKNIFALAFCVKFPGLVSVLSFQLFK